MCVYIQYLFVSGPLKILSVPLVLQNNMFPVQRQYSRASLELDPIIKATDFPQRYAKLALIQHPLCRPTRHRGEHINRRNRMELVLLEPFIEGKKLSFERPDVPD